MEPEKLIKNIGKQIHCAICKKKGVMQIVTIESINIVWHKLPQHWWECNNHQYRCNKCLITDCKETL
jgi:hypothetical protein